MTDLTLAAALRALFVRIKRTLGIPSSWDAMGMPTQEDRERFVREFREGFERGVREGKEKA